MLPMTVYKETESAEQDLSELVRYIASDNPDAADRFFAAVRERYQQLTGNPGMGRLRPDIGTEIRIFPLDGYIVIYRPIPDGILILRFLSGRRDLDALL